MGPKECVECGGSMVGRRATATTCSDACRKARSRRLKANGRKLVPDEAKQSYRERRAVVEREHADIDGEQPPPGQLEAATRAKFTDAGVDADTDPLAIQILGMARVLDTPGSVAPGSLTGMGKSFREAYSDFMEDHEARQREKGGGASDVQAEVAAMLAAL